MFNRNKNRIFDKMSMKYDLIGYLSTIFNRVFDSHKNNSLLEFISVAEEVIAYKYEGEDKNENYDGRTKHSKAEVYRLNALKSFLVASKNYSGEEQQIIRKEIKEKHYQPLADKFGIKI